MNAKDNENENNNENKLEEEEEVKPDEENKEKTKNLENLRKLKTLKERVEKGSSISTKDSNINLDFSKMKEKTRKILCKNIDDEINCISKVSLSKKKSGSPSSNKKAFLCI